LAVFLFQLADALLLGGERFANARLAFLLLPILGYPASDRGRANVHALADVLDAQALFFDHADDFQLQAGVKCFSLSCHVTLLKWWIFHLLRCPGKLDHGIPAGVQIETAWESSGY
jgi:hypothetical protein